MPVSFQLPRLPLKHATWSQIRQTGIIARVLCSSPLVACSVLLGLGACSSESPSAPQASAPEQVPSSQPAFDIESTMYELKDTLEKRATLAREASVNPGAFSRAQADQISDSFVTEWKLVALIRAQQQAQPTWSRGICEWYDAVVKTPNLMQANNMNRAFSHDGPLGSSAAVRIYGDEVSPRAIENEYGVSYFIRRKALDRFSVASPGSGTTAPKSAADLHIDCVNRRFIKP